MMVCGGVGPTMGVSEWVLGLVFVYDGVWRCVTHIVGGGVSGCWGECACMYVCRY